MSDNNRDLQSTSVVFLRDYNGVSTVVFEATNVRELEVRRHRFVAKGSTVFSVERTATDAFHAGPDVEIKEVFEV